MMLLGGSGVTSGQRRHGRGRGRVGGHAVVGADGWVRNGESTGFCVCVLLRCLKETWNAVWNKLPDLPERVFGDRAIEFGQLKWLKN